jgi:hypothetical protein
MEPDAMDCRGFDDRLDALLDGGLAAGERATIEAHAAGCPRCGKLLSLLSAELYVDEVEAPEGLAETVLERTSGAPCARAQELACDLADGVLDPSDAELARLHLGRCPDCGPIARALARLREDLPGLAEAAPGKGFVEGVLARTSRSWPRRMERWRARVAYGFRRLLARPRFAAEGARRADSKTVRTSGDECAGMPPVTSCSSDLRMYPRDRAPTTTDRAPCAAGLPTVIEHGLLGVRTILYQHVPHPSASNARTICSPW